VLLNLAACSNELAHQLCFLTFDIKYLISEEKSQQLQQNWFKIMQIIADQMGG